MSPDTVLLLQLTDQSFSVQLHVGLSICNYIAELKYTSSYFSWSLYNKNALFSFLWPQRFVVQLDDIISSQLLSLHLNTCCRPVLGIGSSLSFNSTYCIKFVTTIIKNLNRLSNILSSALIIMVSYS